jgi:hypothetical protein
MSRLATDPTVPTRLLTVPGATLSTVPVTVPVTGERRARRLLATPPRELMRFLRAASTSRLLAMLLPPTTGAEMSRFRRPSTVLPTPPSPETVWVR